MNERSLEYEAIHRYQMILEALRDRELDELPCRARY
jgi:hypothetical protein